MSDSSLSELVKGAIKVNLNYSATLLNLSKDYLRDFSDAVSKNKQSEQNNTEAGEPDDQQQDKQTQVPTARSPTTIPLILAGRSKEVLNAAMMVNNTSGMSGTVTLCIEGDFPGIDVKVEPETLTMAKDESTIIRILAHMTNKLPVDIDFPGIVKIAEMDMKIAEFVVRRLPDLAKPKTTPRKRKTKPAT